MTLSPVWISIVNAELLGKKCLGKLRIIQCGMTITISSGNHNYLRMLESNDIDTLPLVSDGLSGSTRIFNPFL